jgi:mannose-6-phosphate isomerase-like protein (cupin superfamily)
MQQRGFLNPTVRTADEPMFTVLGILLQFVSTPDQNRGNLSVMRSGIPPGAVIPLHRHTDAEIFYVTEGTMEIFQDDGISSGWQTGKTGEVVTIARGSQTRGSQSRSNNGDGGLGEWTRSLPVLPRAGRASGSVRFAATPEPGGTA